MKQNQKAILLSLAVLGGIAFNGGVLYYVNFDEVNCNANVEEINSFDDIKIDDTQYLANSNFPAFPSLTPLEYLYFYNLYQRLNNTPISDSEAQYIIKDLPFKYPKYNDFIKGSVKNTLKIFNYLNNLDAFLYKLEDVLLLKDQKVFFEPVQNTHQSFDLKKDCVTPNEYAVLYRINSEMRFIDSDKTDYLNIFIKNLSLNNQADDIHNKNLSDITKFHTITIADNNKTFEFVKKYISEYYRHPDRKDYLAYLAQRLYTPQETLEPVIHKTSEDFNKLNTNDYIFINSFLNKHFEDTPYWDLFWLVTISEQSESMKKTSEKFIQKYLQTENRLDFFKDLERASQAQKEQQKQSSHKSNETLKTSYIRNRTQHINE